MKDHLALNDPDCQNAVTPEDWLKIFKKHFQQQYDSSLESIIIDLEYLQHIAIHESVNSRISYIIESNTAIKDVAEKIYDFMNDDLNSLAYYNSWLPQDLYGKFSGLQPDQFTAAIRASIRFQRYHDLGYRVTSPWMVFLTLIEIVLTQANQDQRKQFMDRFFDLRETPYLKVINEALEDELRDMGLFSALAKSKPAVSNDLSNHHFITEYIRYAEVNAKALHTDIKPYPWSAPRYIKTAYVFKDKLATFDYLLAMHESRVGEVFDEDETLNFWGLSHYKIGQSVSKAFLSEIYKLYSKIKVDEMISDELFLKNLQKISLRDNEESHLKRSELEAYHLALKLKAELDNDKEVQAPVPRSPSQNQNESDSIARPRTSPPTNLPPSAIKKTTGKKLKVRFNPFQGPPIFMDSKTAMNATLSDWLKVLKDHLPNEGNQHLELLITAISMLKYLTLNESDKTQKSLSKRIFVTMKNSKNLLEFSLRMTESLNDLNDEGEDELSILDLKVIKRLYTTLSSDDFADFLTVCYRFYRYNSPSSKHAVLWLNFLDLFKRVQDQSNPNAGLKRDFVSYFDLPGFTLDTFVNTLRKIHIPQPEKPEDSEALPGYDFPPEETAERQSVLFMMDENNYFLPTYLMIELSDWNSLTSLHDIEDMYWRYDILNPEEKLSNEYYSHIIGKIREYEAVQSLPNLSYLDAHKHALMLRAEVEEDVPPANVTVKMLIHSPMKKSSLKSQSTPGEKVKRSVKFA